MPTAQTSNLKPGDRLGPYDILRPLGRGGMGEVHLAKQTMMGRDYAVKVLPSEVSGASDFHDRFLREIQVLAALRF